MRTYGEYHMMVEEALPRVFPETAAFGARAVEAARYSLCGGGKRLRPVLVLSACEFAGGDAEKALPAACALECLHTYSLIHDDLPAMDDDDLRRGRPSCHKAYGEGFAILAGDGLQALAFSLLAHTGCMGALAIVADAVGFSGMVGGQSADMELSAGDVDPRGLSYIQAHKTGALIRACVLAGLSIGGAEQEDMARFARFGNHLGAAFQIADDILDATSTAQELGKTPGKDQTSGKATCVSLLGLEGARERLVQASAQALEALDAYGERADFFRDLTRGLASRKR